MYLARVLSKYTKSEENSDAEECCSSRFCEACEVMRFRFAGAQPGAGVYQCGLGFGFVRAFVVGN